MYCSNSQLYFRFISLRIPGRVWSFSPLHCVQTGSGAPPSLLSNGYRRFLSPGIKRQEREADLSLQSTAEIKNAWSYTSTPAVSVHCVVLKQWIRLHLVVLNEAQGQLYLYLSACGKIADLVVRP